MAFKKYTQCVDVKNHKGKTLMLGEGGLLAVGAAVATLVFGSGLAPGAVVGALWLLIIYCKWWLYDRLICLGGDRCAIGLVQAVEPPGNKSGLDAFDTDYSFTMLLAPHGTATAPFTGSQDYLVQEQDTTANEKDLLGAKRLDFRGYEVKVPGFTSATWHFAYDGLHCEFEGGGIPELLDAARSALPLAIAAAVACSIPIPLFGIVCAILEAIVAFISLAGVISALANKGKPSDVNPDLDELMRYEDILFVKGEWVYDSAHEGWNEIHPIRHCQRIGRWIGNHETAEQWNEHFEAWQKADRPPSLPPPPPPTPPLPPPPPPPTTFLMLDTDKTFGGNYVRARITFTTSPIPTGVVTLSSDHPEAVVPASIQTNSKTAVYQFFIATKPVTSEIKATITATFNSTAEKKELLIRPVPTAEQWRLVVEKWCRAVDAASAPLTVNNQKLPQNQWRVHPVVDGCRPEEHPGPH